jgi:hypothetical protein
MTIAAVTSVSPGDSRLASRLINTVQQIGGALGLGILAARKADCVTQQRAYAMIRLDGIVRSA